MKNTSPNAAKTSPTIIAQGVDFSPDSGSSFLSDSVEVSFGMTTIPARSVVVESLFT
ncbi:hypothetical protein M0R79_00520 [Ignavigranum ruoffiae]|nr:hypothetical protein [Ignavigranum ruoffiae]UPQ85893.1 hypothetical protein M0R79_00520 [Ignavigranum ruoffiae]